MTDLDETTEPVDGRVARRQRNVDAVLDVVLEMFTEDAMFPTIEQVATRSGLSLRSMYRYFSDPAELVEAAIKRGTEDGHELSRLHAIGEGPLATRIEDFVAMRVRLHDHIGPRFRATAANATRHQRIRDERSKNRDSMREQFELQFAPELAKLTKPQREAVIAAGDLLTQLDSLDYLREQRQLSTKKCHEALVASLVSLLG